MAGAERPEGRADLLYRAVLVNGRVRREDRVRVVDRAGRPLDWTVLTSHGSRMFLNDHGDGFHVLDLSAAA
ncbi:hypothetical protein ACFFMR_32485 [Micromonospora andamanensis]|uniref:Uncharacterized protein n=1 Tax=Micromonospora andamanensis TaxID=1287068 RepID=A0ABQ4I208_9ACTN|nr:hypothetical protein [Micromonospora andamanensis]GIJ11926.1 hypothetical protein Van01_51400 [Micromonospora andamanensis]GIJ42177.1 hypothetical protein Vwe01_55020 [Micromonospora andamanensis]